MFVCDKPYLMAVGTERFTDECDTLVSKLNLHFNEPVSGSHVVSVSKIDSQTKTNVRYDSSESINNVAIRESYSDTVYYFGITTDAPSMIIWKFSSKELAESVRAFLITNIV